MADRAALYAAGCVKQGAWSAGVSAQASARVLMPRELLK